MANTYVAIQSITVSGSSTATVTFSNIPTTYTDFVVRFTGRSANAGSARRQVYMTINSTTANYSRTRIYTQASVAYSDRNSNQTEMQIGSMPAGTATSNTFGSGEVYIPNYLAATNKPLGTFVVQENNNTDTEIHGVAGLWSNTAAITSISFAIGPGDNWVDGSTFHLYGIKNT